MINRKLIIFEGIPGSGKTTTSKLLHKYLLERGLPSNIFIEGSDHPIDLPFYAFLSVRQYEDLVLEYQLQAKWLRENSIFEEDYVLIPYKVPEPFPQNTSLVEYLSSKEFCYSTTPVVSFDKFKSVFFKRFQKYVDGIIHKNEITIFESVLFQHQLHDINRLYPEVENSEILEYLSSLSHILAPLDPVLFYISQDCVRDALKHTALIRSKPKWGTEETIAYYEKRKEVELQAIKDLPFHSVILNNTNRDWDTMMEIIKLKLALT